MQPQPLSLPAVPEPTYGERLKNKVVIITGAAQGIGEAIVACFQAQQARLVIADIQTEKVEQVAAHWRERGAEIVAQAVDITSKEQWQALVNVAIERFGRVDVLINCAGVNVFRDPLQMTDEDWRRCFAIDLDGAWFGCRTVLPHMIEQGSTSHCSERFTPIITAVVGDSPSSWTVGLLASSGDPRRFHMTSFTMTAGAKRCSSPGANQAPSSSWSRCITP